MKYNYSECESLSGKYASCFDIVEFSLMGFSGQSLEDDGFIQVSMSLPWKQIHGDL